MPRKRVRTDAQALRALATGRALAKEVLEFRRTALAAREVVVRRRARVRARAVPTRIRPQLVRAAGSPANAGTLVAEGDSWFDYPWDDVLRMLEDRHGYDVESVAHAGDEVQAMAYSGGQLEEFTRRIERLLRQGTVPRAILLSGGGNDVAGDQFGTLLNHVSAPEPGLNEHVVSAILDERVRSAYVTILRAVSDVCRVRLGSEIPILVHGYDYAVPDGRGFLGGWWILPGPWLEPGFREKGYEDMQQRKAIIRQLIDRFNAMLQNVVALRDFKHVRYVNLRRTLDSGPRYKDFWANELHPTGRGFAAVAERFAQVIG